LGLLGTLPVCRWLYQVALQPELVCENCHGLDRVIVVLPIGDATDARKKGFLCLQPPRGTTPRLPGLAPRLTN
jgi:hypothetical protein